MKIKFLDGTEKEFESLKDADLRYADLQYADLQYVNLQGADLQGADLQGADLRGADLRGACLDFSCFPLWCGSLEMKVDIDFVNQLLYHVCMLDFADTEGIKELIKSFANKASVIQKHNLNPY